MFLDYLNGACRCKLCQYGNFAQPIQLQDFLLLFSRFSIEIVVECSNLNEMEEPEIGSKFLPIILMVFSLHKLNSIELIVCVQKYMTGPSQVEGLGGL